MNSTLFNLVSTSRLRYGAGALILLSALFACAHGKLIPLPPGQDDIETFVKERYQGLEASYSGTWEKPGALRFDIKGDGIQLTGSGWQPLETEAAILEIVGNMKNTYRKYKGFVGVRGPQLYAIMGVDNRTIGYIYSPIDYIPVRPVGTNYEVDAITEVDVRRMVYPNWGDRRGQGWGGGRR